ncbi:transposase [Streptomyces sp. H27-G5]|nr:transposase [Streptomyces sp. H27-G5]MCY0923602.1 transposase [Streptomyces sp. H27-G5]
MAQNPSNHRKAHPLSTTTTTRSRSAPVVRGGLPGPAGEGTHPARKSDRSVWENFNTHLTTGRKLYEAEHDWLTTVRLPAYAPDLNPVEAVWSLVRGAMANTAFETSDDLDRKLRRELRRIQLQPRLVDGCLTATCLPLNPPTPH